MSREVRLASLSGRRRSCGPAGRACSGRATRSTWPWTSSVEPIDTTRFADLAHVVNGLEHVHAMVSTCLADVPPPVRGLVWGRRLIAENCLKHIRPCIYHPRETRGMVEMAQVLLDGKLLAVAPSSAWATRPAPLRWSDLALGAFRESSGHGVPMMVNAEPAGGVTAPATLAGELVLGNAEALSGVVICQALEPGRPLVFNMVSPT